MRSAFIKIIKLILQLLLVVHLLACFFYLTSFLFPGAPIIGAAMSALPSSHVDYVNATVLQERSMACYNEPDYETYGPMVNSWVCENGLGPGNVDAARKYANCNVNANFVLKNDDFILKHCRLLCLQSEICHRRILGDHRQFSMEES